MNVFFRIVFILFGSMLFFNLTAQPDSSVIVFEKKAVDFGYAFEIDGNFTISYRFENKGNDNLVISRLISSVLKVIEYPQKPILPGESAEIIMELNPKSRQENFAGKFLVFSNAVNSPVELSASGKILSGSHKSTFKFSVGDIGFRQSQINFGYVFKGEEKLQSIPVLNNSASWLKVQFTNIPDYLYIVPAFDSIPPGKTGMIDFCFSSEQCADWDFIIDKIRVDVIGNDTTSGQISFTSNIREKFALQSEEDKLNRPLALIPVKVFNFDTISHGEVHSYNFEVKNEGKSPLLIRALKPTCGCTAAMPEKTTIAPGESTSVHVSFDATGFSGQTKKGVTIITNDPVNYKQFLWVSGYIKN